MVASLRIREAAEVDGDAIGEVHAAAWLAAYGDIFDSDFLIDAAESRRVGWPHAITGFLAPPNVLLVGVLDGRVVAYAHGTATETEDMAEVAGFYCHPDAWGSGISMALIERTKRELAEVFSDVILWTLRDADRARRFYEKVGFHFTGNVQNQALTSWTTGAVAERPAVEYITTLAR